MFAVRGCCKGNFGACLATFSDNLDWIFWRLEQKQIYSMTMVLGFNGESI
jgi:hypothetical protein